LTKPSRGGDIDESDSTESEESVMRISKARSGSWLILAAVLATGACDRAPQYTDQEHVQRAKAFQDQGQLDSALIELKNALQKNPKNSEARWRLAEVYIGKGLGEPAESELKKAKELGMDSEALKIPKGQALLLQGLYPRVLLEIQPGPNSTPENVAKILEIEGRAHHGLLNFDEGCRLFAESVERDPKYVPGYWGLARCAAARDKFDQARAELKKAIELDQKNSGTWVQVGDLEVTAKHLPEAESAYANALQYRSDNVDALLHRAALRIDKNELAEASQDLDAAFKLSKDRVIVNQLRGIVQFKQGKLADAEASFETALKAHPNYLPALAWLGYTNLARKNYEQAARQFARYTRNAPDTHIEALLGLAQARLGRGEVAEETLRALRDLDIVDPRSLAVLAQAHMTLGETDLAAAYMAKAVEKNPEAAELRVGLASALSQKGETPQAIAQLESATRLDPGMVDADVLLIQNLIREKQFDKALQAVESLEKKQPKNPTTFILKGTVYLAKSDPVNARKSFEQALALDATSIEAASNLAQLDVTEKNPTAARQRFQTILAKDNKNVLAMIGLAGVAAATGEESEYVAWLEKAAQTEPSAVRPRLLLASYYLQKHDVHKALTMAQEAQTASPHDVNVLDVLGSAQTAAGDQESAVITYGKLANAIPMNPVAHYRLATAQVAVQNFDAATISLNKALALKPDYLDAEILLASAQLKTGRYRDAMNIAQQIQKQHPESATGVALQGDVLMAQKQFAPALKAYEKASAINNDSDVLAVKTHQALTEGGNAKEADARLVRWLKDHPSNVPARAYLASSYMGAAQNKQAIEQYQLVLQNDPKNILALNNLAWLYQQEKDQRALATAEQAYLLKSDSATVMDTLGWILVEQGDTARGLKLLRAASEKAPEATGIRYHWAAALAKSGDRAGARRELADLLAKNKKFPERQDALELLKQL
jgi:putative PEP-CTERM system TPR-repeat lipoprotein